MSKVYYNTVRKKETPEEFDADIALKNGFFGSLLYKISPDPASKLKMKMAFGAFCEKFFLFVGFRKLTDGFLKTRVRSCAPGFIGFGFLVALLSFFNVTFSGVMPLGIPELVFGAAIVVGSIPMAFSSKRWCEALSKSSLFGLYLFRFCGYRGGEISREGECPAGGRVAVLAGVLAGVLTSVVNPFVLVFYVLTFLVLLQILFKPEIGLSFELLLFAFVPRIYLIGLALFTLFAFAVKIFRGKRVLRFDCVDVFVLLLFIFWSVNASFGALTFESVFLAFVLYFLFSKMALTSDSAQRLLGIFVFTLLAFSVTFFFIGFVRDSGNVFATYIKSVFDPDKNTFVVPIDTVMMLIPVAAVGVVMNKMPMKFISFLSLSLGLCTLLLGGTTGTLISFFFSIIILIVLLKKTMIWMTAALAALGAALTALLPGAILPLFTEVPALFIKVFSSIPNAVSSAFSQPLVNVLFGGANLYDLSQTSLWLDMFYRFGLVGIAVFILALVFITRKIIFSISSSKDKMISSLALALSVCVLTVLLRGAAAAISVESGAVVFSFLILGFLGGLCRATDNFRPKE